MLNVMQEFDPTTRKLGRFPHMQTCADACRDTHMCEFFTYSRPPGNDDFVPDAGDCFMEYADTGIDGTIIDPPDVALDQCDQSGCGGDWMGSFDHEGWSTCNLGCAMTGLTRASCHGIHCIEDARCCRVAEATNQTTCRDIDISGDFDSEATVKCPNDEWMAGLERAPREGSHSR